jgi:hypothetical protein
MTVLSWESPFFSMAMYDGFHGDAVATARAPEMRQAVLAKIFFKASFHYYFALPHRVYRCRLRFRLG